MASWKKNSLLATLLVSLSIALAVVVPACGGGDDDDTGDDDTGGDDAGPGIDASVE